MSKVILALSAIIAVLLFVVSQTSANYLDTAAVNLTTDVTYYGKVNSSYQYFTYDVAAGSSLSLVVESSSTVFIYGSLGNLPTPTNYTVTVASNMSVDCTGSEDNTCWYSLVEAPCGSTTSKGTWFFLISSNGTSTFEDIEAETEVEIAVTASDPTFILAPGTTVNDTLCCYSERTYQVTVPMLHNIEIDLVVEASSDNLTSISHILASKGGCPTLDSHDAILLINSTSEVNSTKFTLSKTTSGGSLDRGVWFITLVYGTLSNSTNPTWEIAEPVEFELTVNKINLTAKQTAIYVAIIAAIAIVAIIVIVAIVGVAVYFGLRYVKQKKELEDRQKYGKLLASN